MPGVWARAHYQALNVPSVLDADLASADNIRVVCAGEPITVTATPGFDTYTWVGPGVSGSGNTATINIPPASVTTQPDTFTIHVTGQLSSTGCGASGELTVIAYKTRPYASFVLNATPGDPTVTVDNTSLYATECLWDFGDGFVTNNCEPLSHTYSSLGSYTITLIASNPCGSDTIQRTVTLTDAQVPNPAYRVTYYFDGQTLYLDNLDAAGTRLQILDVSGKVVMHQMLTGAERATLKLDHLPTGVYQVRLEDHQGELIGLFRISR